MEYIENRTFDEIEIGDTATLERTLTPGCLAERSAHRAPDEPRARDGCANVSETVVHHGFDDVQAQGSRDVATNDTRAPGRGLEPLKDPARCRKTERIALYRAMSQCAIAVRVRANRVSDFLRSTCRRQ
jgi:hypothetical protein